MACQRFSARRGVRTSIVQSSPDRGRNHALNWLAKGEKISSSQRERPSKPLRSTGWALGHCWLRRMYPLYIFVPSTNMLL